MTPLREPDRTSRRGWLLAALACALARPATAQQAAVVAIVLETGETMGIEAAALNARLRERHAAGFVLDPARPPPLVLVRRSVRAADVEALMAAVRRALEVDVPPAELRPVVHGLASVEEGGFFRVDYVIERQPALLRLRKRLLEAVQPFETEGQPPLPVGPDYQPAVAVGVGPPDFVKDLLAEPFRKFIVRPVGLSLR